jgi:hypothetical protein
MLLTVLFAAPALMAVHGACVIDPDVWWHLRTGEWIVQHHAAPHTDPFTRFGAGQPWAAYSWLFELIVLKLFHLMGLAGIVTYTAGMILAITVALFHLIKRVQHKADFSFVALLTFAACFSLTHLYTPRSWMFSILFFVLEIDILMHARKTGRVIELAWLPLIFALWANLHIQFIDGLLVLGLAVAESVLANWWNQLDTKVPATWMYGAFGASVLATLLNPYGWHLYIVAHDLAAQSGVMNRLSELQAMPFRDLSDYLVLFFAMGAAAVLATAVKLPIFETLLLVFATVVSFRSQRDAWVMVTVASTILAGGIPGSRKAQSRLPWFGVPLAALAAAVIVTFGFRVMHVDNPRLAELLAEKMPVKAVAFVKEKGYAGPLYNDFAWGGYLMWSLRMPVSIDGRAALDGDERIERSIATWGAQPGWNTDLELASSGLVIGHSNTALVQILKTDARFRMVYQDDVATVFQAQTPGVPKS